MAESAVLLLLLLSPQGRRGTGLLCLGAGGCLPGSQLRSPPADALLAELEQSSQPASTDYTLLAPSSAEQDAALAGPSAPCSQKPRASAAPKVMLRGHDKRDRSRDPAQLTVVVPAGC